MLINIGFAKLLLPPGVIGQFETFVLVSGMVSFFWVSGIINSLVALYPKKSPGEQEDLIFNTFIALVLLSAVAAGGLLLFADNLLAFLHKNEGNSTIRLAVFYVLFSTPAFIGEYVLFLHDRKKELLLYGIACALLILAAALVPVLLHLPVAYAMEGLVVFAMLKLAYTLVVIGRYGTFRFNAALLIQTLKFSLPLILSVFVSGSAEYIDGIIVKGKFDDMFFAIYRYGAKELPILLVVANTLSTGMIPAISANLEDGLKELKEKSGRLMHIFFPISIVLMLASPYLYLHVFNSSFIYSALIFNIYLLLVIPRVLFPQTILIGLHRPRFVLISSIIEIIINVSVSVYLADKVGLAGIAAGTFVAYTFDKLFLMAVAFWVFGISPNRYVKLIPYLVYVTLLLVAFFAGLVLLQNI
ncbi:MAG TPA: oligosaccharide flippase family protein [Chitinophagales bacterium]|nr:oligosaccharide flippase family protein [Chitinophagales bacterium]